MFKKENLIKLQKELKKDNVEAFLILTSDPHGSEYCADHFLELRKYFCPFSGSAGQLLILQNEAYLFTDGRYWIQAKKELENSGITLVRDGDKGAPTLIELIKSKYINICVTT